MAGILSLKPPEEFPMRSMSRTSKKRIKRIISEIVSGNVADAPYFTSDMPHKKPGDTTWFDIAVSTYSKIPRSQINRLNKAGLEVIATGQTDILLRARPEMWP